MQTVAWRRRAYSESSTAAAEDCGDELPRFHARTAKERQTQATKRQKNALFDQDRGPFERPAAKCPFIVNSVPTDVRFSLKPQQGANHKCKVICAQTLF